MILDDPPMSDPIAMGSPKDALSPELGRLRSALLLLLFFLSGAAALIYQVLWLKELGRLFGVTSYAAATTLAVFPAVTVLGEASSGDPESQWNRVFFIPVCCFIGYNVGMEMDAINIA